MTLNVISNEPFTRAASNLPPFGKETALLGNKCHAKIVLWVM